MAQGLFDDPAAFQNYAQQMAQRLKGRWEERVRFLRASVAQIEALTRVAEAVGDSEAVIELAAQSALAQQELKKLESALGGPTGGSGGGPAPPRPQPPEPALPASNATILRPMPPAADATPSVEGLPSAPSRDGSVLARTRRMVFQLGTGEQSLEWVENRTLWEALGGIGRSFPWIREHYQKIADAYDSRNPLIINVGAVTGTKAMTGLRVYFSAFSPLKQSRKDDPGIAYSAASGDFGTCFRKTGLNDLVLLGKAEHPSILILEGDGDNPTARLEDGGWLLGRSTDQKIKALRGRHPEAHFAVIGPAGENLVRFAAVACSTARQLKGTKMMRFAGRAGMGAVMMSKNIVAIVARGTGKVQTEVTNTTWTPFNKEVSKGEGSARYRDLGTWPFNIEALTGPKGGLPIRNFSHANDERARSLYVGKVRERYAVDDQNCTACGIKCWKVLKDGPTELAKLDHEPLTLLGPNLDIWDIGKIAHLVELGDEMGMDSISLGGVLAYAMEHQLDGLKFGDAHGAEDAIRRIATGQCPLLAQGVRRLARQVGDEGSAIHVHGLELAAYLGNTDPGAAFSLVGNHMTMATFNSAINKLITTLDEWEREIVDLGLRRLVYDMIGLCKFANTPMDQWEPILREMGIDCKVDDLYAASLEIYRQGRQLDYAQGFTYEDDTLPERCFQQLPGQGIPQFMTRDFLEQLKPRVYSALRI